MHWKLPLCSCPQKWQIQTPKILNIFRIKSFKNIGKRFSISCFKNEIFWLIRHAHSSMSLFCKYFLQKLLSRLSSFFRIQWIEMYKYQNTRYQKFQIWSNNYLKITTTRHFYTKFDKWALKTYWGGSVAFSIMQTRDRLEPVSMWYSSSARMNASGVSTFNSTRCDLMLPSFVVT